MSGRLNCRADSLSRKPKDHCYSLPLNIFSYLCKKFSTFPVIDLFADRLNNKLPNYISEGPDPYASGFDAFILPWPQSIYAFPPVHLVNKFLNRFIAQDIKYGLLICPFWPSQPYFATLLNLLIDNPLIISASVLENPETLPSNLSHLMVSSITSNYALQKEFLQKQPVVSSGLSKPLPSALTCDVGNNSQIGVIHNRLILAQYL